MKILLDECMDWRSKYDFPGHDVFSVKDMNWLGKKNGELMTLAFNEGFQVLATIDKNLVFQLNLKKYTIGILVFDQTQSTLQNLGTVVTLKTAR